MLLDKSNHEVKNLTCLAFNEKIISVRLLKNNLSAKN